MIFGEKPGYKATRPHVLNRPVGRGGGGVRGGSLEPHFWAPKDFIYTAIVHFKCPTGPLVSLLLRITAVQASLRGFVPRGPTPNALA